MFQDQVTQHILDIDSGCERKAHGFTERPWVEALEISIKQRNTNNVFAHRLLPVLLRSGSPKLSKRNCQNKWKS